MKLLSILLLFTFSAIQISLASNTVPRQKIQILGLLKPNAPKELSISDLEKMKEQKVFSIHDPYNKNILTKFSNVTLSSIVDQFAKNEATTLQVGAIDGYKIDIKIEDIKKLNLYLAYKDEKGYLTVDRMGPARIIENREGIISKDVLMKIGVNWSWQVKSFEFKK